MRNVGEEGGDVEGACAFAGEEALVEIEFGRGRSWLVVELQEENGPFAGTGGGEDVSGKDWIVQRDFSA